MRSMSNLFKETLAIYLQTLVSITWQLPLILFDRLPDPEKFLNDVAKFILPDGILIILSPYTWLQDYTPKEKWLGGKTANARERLYSSHS